MEKLNSKEDFQDTEKTGVEYKMTKIQEDLEERREEFKTSSSLESNESELQKVEDKEEVKQQQLTELRERLGISISENVEGAKEKDLDQSHIERRDSALEGKSNENILYSIKNLSENVDELSKSIKRNKFQKTNLNAEGLLNVAQKGELNQKDLLSEIQRLAFSINKIAPPDPRDGLLEPRNFRSVIEEMENVYTKLSKLKSVSKNENSSDDLNLLNEISRAQNSLTRRKDELQNSLSLLQRYKGR